MSRRIWIVAVAAALVACQGSPPTTPGPTPPRKTAGPSQAPSAGPTGAAPGTPAPVATTTPPLTEAAEARVLGLVRLPAGLIANKGGGLISDHGAGIIANNGGAIIANNGSGLVSNNGGGILSNNGSSYRLQAAPAQVPINGLRVELLDGAGNPILKDGQPVFTTTNAEGAYGFTVAPGERNTLVRIALPDGKGTAQAIVPKGTARVDVDLVSTLTTTYILDRYVAGNGDAQATLDKLPAAVEAETRAKAAAALSAAPPDLTAARVTALVDDLRKADPALDAQLETVKRLLIAAGQSNLGDGQLGTAVSLVDVRDLLAAPDGVLYFTAANGQAFSKATPRRLWKLGSDEKLTAVFDGNPRALAFDGEGRLTFVDADPFPNPFMPTWLRLMALGADGKVAEKLFLRDAYRCAVPAADGGLLVVGTENNGYVLDRLPGGNPHTPAASPWPEPPAAPAGTRIGTYAPSADLNRALGDLRGLARAADGGLLLASRTAVVKLGPTVETVTTLAGEGARSLALGADGAIWLELDGKLAVKPAGGARTPVAGTPPATHVAIRPETPPNPFEPPPPQVPIMGPVAQAADGTRYVSDGLRIYEVRPSGFARVAGLEVGATPPPENSALDLKTPAGLATAPDGTLFVADRDAHRVYRVDPDGKVAVMAGTGTAGSSGDGGPATAAQLQRPTDVAIDPAGGLLILDQTPEAPDGLQRFKSTAGVIRRVAPDGTISVRHAPPAKTILKHLLARRGAGPWLVSEFSETGEPPSPVGGAPTSLRVDTLDAPVRALNTDLNLYAGFAADGETLYAWRDHELYRSTGGGAMALLKAFTGPHEVVNVVGQKAFLPLLNGQPVPIGPNRLAVDAKGRLVLAIGAVLGAYGTFDHHVVRWDPVADSLTLLAGKGSTRFPGTGIDDGLKNPQKPAFDAAGNLYFLDVDHRQVKRIPADQL